MAQLLLLRKAPTDPEPQVLPPPDAFVAPQGVTLVSSAAHPTPLSKLEQQQQRQQQWDFDVRRFFSELTTSCYGRTLILGESAPSTQDVLSMNKTTLPVGTVCVVDRQTQGRGRGGNTWESPRGCLMFSLLFSEDDGRKLPLVQYVVAVAMIQAVDSLTAQRKIPRLPMFLKWPNDFYTRSQKIGGILCTSTYTEKVFHVVAGVGINVSNSKPTTCINDLVAAAAASSPGAASVDQQGQRITLDELLAAFLNAFERLHTAFQSEGFDRIKEAYLERWLHSGQDVFASEDITGGAAKTRLRIEGLTASGYLLAVDERGQQFELSPDGNSFDFLQGLVKRKL